MRVFLLLYAYIFMRVFMGLVVKRDFAEIPNCQGCIPPLRFFHVHVRTEKFMFF